MAQLRHEPRSPVLLTGGLILTNGPVLSGPVTHALSEGAGHCSRHEPKRGGEEHFLGYPVPVGFFFFFPLKGAKHSTTQSYLFQQRKLYEVIFNLYFRGIPEK